MTLNANVTSAAGTVNAGTVTFTVFNSSSVQVGSAVTSGTVSSNAASASYTLPGNSPPGTYTIQAVYNGSTNFATSSDNISCANGRQRLEYHHRVKRHRDFQFQQPVGAAQRHGDQRRRHSERRDGHVYGA